MNKSAVLRARVDPKFKARVTDFISRHPMDEADLVRWAVIEYLNAHESEGLMAAPASLAEKSVPYRIVGKHKKKVA